MRRLAILAGALCISACTLLLGFEDGHERSDPGPGDDGGVTEGGGEGGTIVTGDVAVSPGSLDFGDVGCTGAPAPRLIQIKSLSAAPVKYTAQAQGSPNFSILDGQSGIIAPGETATIKVATSIPSGAAAGEILLAVGGDLLHIQLKATTGGPRLELRPPACDFGKVRVDTDSLPCAVSLVNTGQTAASVGLPAAAPPYTLTWSSPPASLAPDASVGATLVFHPTTPTTSTGKYDLQTDASLCGAKPSLAATGTGSSDPVVVQPGKLDFGLMPCGSTPAPRNVSIQNYGATAFTFNPVLVSGTYFTVSAGGSVPADGGVAVSVSPKAVPLGTPGAISDNLTVTTDLGGDTPHQVAISGMTQGAVLTFMPSALVFPTGKTKSFSLQNTGNSAVTVMLSIALSGQGFTVSPTAPQNIPGGGGTLAGTVTFAAPATGTFTSAVKVTVTGAQCAATPSLGLMGTK